MASPRNYSVPPNDQEAEGPTQYEAPIDELRQYFDERPVSIPAEDAPQGADDASTPWNIVSRAQIKKWAADDPDLFLIFLNEVREQRDLALDAAIVLHHATEERHAERERERRRQTDDRHRRRQAEQQVEELRELRRAEIQARDNTPVSTRSTLQGRRSQKLPDPDLLTNGGKPTWEDWIHKMRAKLAINSDHFDNESAKFGYVLSRLGGQAASHTYARSPYSSTSNPYLTVDEVLKNLQQMFEDSDKDGNYRREYKSLTQGGKKFSDFYMEFYRLSSYLELSEKQLLYDFSKKISPRLLNVLDNLLPQPTSVEAVKDHLVQLDNKHRARKQLKESATELVRPSLRPFKKVSFGSIPATASSPTPSRSPPPFTRSKSPPMDPQRRKDEDLGNCYNCHQSGHTAGNCPQRPVRQATPPPRSGTPYVPPFRHTVNKIDISDDDRTSQGTDDSEN